MTAATVTISDAQKQQFEDEGYFILERVIPEAHLEILRGECQRFIDMMDAEMDKAGTDVLGISHRNKRYFVSLRYKESAHLRDFLFSDLMADICQATLGETAYLFWEQYVVKSAEVGMKFSWHQDSGFVDTEHRPYISCWCPLDDVNEQNGTVYLLPFSRAGTKQKVEHVRDPQTNDKIGYHGDDPGEVVIVPAGSVVVFSSTAFHRSGPNITDRMRRVYLAQYSAEPILKPDGTPYGLVEPVLRDGTPVQAP